MLSCMACKLLCGLQDADEQVPGIILACSDATGSGGLDQVLKLMMPLPSVTAKHCQMYVLAICMFDACDSSLLPTQLLCSTGLPTSLSSHSNLEGVDRAVQAHHTLARLAALSAGLTSFRQHGWMALVRTGAVGRESHCHRWQAPGPAVPVRCEHPRPWHYKHRQQQAEGMGGAGAGSCCGCGCGEVQMTGLCCV